MTPQKSPVTWLLTAALALCAADAAHGAGPPAWLPRYDVNLDLDVAGNIAKVHFHAVWTNRTNRPARELVFNAHSRYIVPDADVGLMAKTLEILRMNPGEVLGVKEPAFELHRVTLPAAQGSAPVDLPFHYEGDTSTALVVPLPRPVAAGQSIGVDLDFTMHLPKKQGRWGCWEGVTALSNWLPLFAYYDDSRPAEEPKPDHASRDWQPTPFVPWHQPFFNEAGIFRVTATVPSDQVVATSGTIVATTDLGDGRKRVVVEADGIRDFAFLCSQRYQSFEAVVPAGPGIPAPVRLHVLAFKEHEHYAREMLRLAGEAIETYSHWFGPYPWKDFTIAESFFGWNGNECATLVMIDERVFGMPHLAGGYVEYLIYHETCHQWWYNLIGTNGYSETWMDEAMATHFAHRLLNQRVGKNNKLMKYPSGLEWLPNIHREDYRTYGLLGSFGRGDNMPILQDMKDFQHLINLFSMAYDKGARIVGMIEERLDPRPLIGDPGDSPDPAFLAFCRTIYAKYQYRVIRVADYQRELEAFTGFSWESFFHDWLYGSGLSDWAVDKVVVQEAPCALKKFCLRRRLRASLGPNCLEDQADRTRVVVMLSQRAEYNEQTTLGFVLPGSEGYSVRVPIIPQATSYRLEDPPCSVEVVGDKKIRVEVLLPAEPTQIAVDPDQILVDKDPSNNFWKPPLRWRVTPVYTFLEETDLTNAYDRWNVILGPWIYGTAYADAWYTRSTMLGARAGAYKTQDFDGGVYSAYRTDYRDVVVGVDALWDHWPDAHWQLGFNAERRLVATDSSGDDNAFRGVLFARHIIQYGDSLYLPPMQYLDIFTQYQDNFLPDAREASPGGVRWDRQMTAGLHYRLDYRTPYWDPEGGIYIDADVEGGYADVDGRRGLTKGTLEAATVKYLPNLSSTLVGMPKVYDAARPVLDYLAQTRIAMRAYGATSEPSRGEFFSMGGDTLFRGFDLSRRQGSSVWVGSVEWRFPLAQGLRFDVCDHIASLHEVYGAAFYDVGDAYTSGHEVGPIAHAVGGGLRLDVTWFGFVERTTLRMDVAKTLNSDSGTQFWFGFQQPF